MSELRGTYKGHCVVTTGLMGCPRGHYAGLGWDEAGCAVYPGLPLKGLDQQLSLRAVTRLFLPPGDRAGSTPLLRGAVYAGHGCTSEAQVHFSSLMSELR